jgi:hypothetical protein
MPLTNVQKEMLFVLGEFFKKTDKQFSAAHLEVSVSKAEFIDVIKGVKVVSKQNRALYRNLESLQKSRYIVYNDRELSFSKKGYAEYDKIRTELMRLKQIEANMATQRLQFKRKIQARLK